MSKSSCPTTAELAAHLRGETSVAIESHLSECEACLKQFDRLMEEEHGTMMNQIRQDGPIALIEDKEPVPDKIGVYKIVRKIGQGGMGVVYEAVHTELERRVAIKLVRSADPHFLDRFQREKKIAGLFQHPNIVEATDAGMFNGKPYLVSEFLVGSDLQDLVKKDGLLPWQRAVSIIAQAAKGLDHLHRKGVIHRDIKPSNIFLTDDGVVKILDLGLARQASQSENATKHTMTGQVVGSPGFMPPEQFRGATVDARSDMYSLGCTLVYLLTGKPSSDEQDKLPPELRPIIARMTAGMPDQRFQSMAELIPALDSLSKTGSPQKKIMVWAAVGIVVLLLLGFVMTRSCSSPRVPVGDDTPANIESYETDKARYKREKAEYDEAMKEWKKTMTGNPPIPPDPPEGPYAPGQ